MKTITTKEYLDYQIRFIVARLATTPLSEFYGFEKLAKKSVDSLIAENGVKVEDWIDTSPDPVMSNLIKRVEILESFFANKQPADEMELVKEELEKKLAIAKEALEILVKNPLATKGNYYDYGDEFYLVEVKGEMVGIRTHCREALKQIGEV